MARTSKKNRAGYHEESNLPPEKMYSVGIYARLSVDSEYKPNGQERKNESIESQIEIANEFIRQRKDMIVYDRYIDIGRTGTNFEREGFERMMQDVRMRRVDCIVVKDLSRFGRNHIETGNYIEKIFPFMGVRFIAVTDHFDSMDTDGGKETWGIGLKNLVNEMYARDIAVKVKSGKRAKWEQGSYTGGTPPYGYRAEWKGNRKCLLVDDSTSGIVKKIFDLFLSGRNMKEIARWLYDNQVVRPTIYRKTGQVYSQNKDGVEQWPGATIKMILTNPVYIGCLARKHTCGEISRMRQMQDMYSGDWLVKEHTHEAIISEEVFFQAARKFEKSQVNCDKDNFLREPIDEDIFEGILYCGDCGSKMGRVSSVRTFGARNKMRIYSYDCPRHNRIDELCCVGKNISLYTLTSLIREAVRQEFALSAMRSGKIIEASNREAKALKKEWEKRMADIEKEAGKMVKSGSELYLKFRMGEMDEECYEQMKKEGDKKAALLQGKKAAIEEKLNEIDAQTAKKNDFLRSLMKGSKKGGLTAEAVQALINRIEVYPDHRVKVIFAFKRKNILPGKQCHLVNGTGRCEEHKMPHG